MAHVNLIGWVIGGGLSSLTGSLERAYKAKLDAKNDADRLEAEKQIAFFKGQIELAQAAAEHDKWWSPRTLMGYAAAAYVVKIVFYDTVLGLGVTPNPGEQVTAIVLTIIGFYFGSKALGDVAGRIASAIRGRK